MISCNVRTPNMLGRLAYHLSIRYGRTPHRSSRSRNEHRLERLTVVQRIYRNDEHGIQQGSSSSVDLVLRWRYGRSLSSDTSVARSSYCLIVLILFYLHIRSSKCAELSLFLIFDLLWRLIHWVLILQPLLLGVWVQGDEKRLLYETRQPTIWTRIA
jgi:hypothetical protein